MKKIFALSLVLTLVACGTSSETPNNGAGDQDAGDVGLDTMTDSSLETGPDALPICDPMSGLPATAEITEGGRIIVPLASGWSYLLPDDWKLYERDSDAVIRAPYGSEGSFEVSVVSDCDDPSMILMVSVKPIATTQLSTWSRGQAGFPLAREHAPMWIDGNFIYMFGGLAYEPQQFTPTFDGWKFDLETLVWTELTQTGEVPELVANRVAYVPGDGAYLSGGATANLESPHALSKAEISGDEMVWTNLASTGSTGGAHILNTFIYDAPRDRFVSVYGQTTANHKVGVNVTEGRNSDWRNIETDVEPGERYGQFFGYDSDNERVILFSGARQPITNDDPVNAADDTWALYLSEEPPRWERIAADSDPPGRRNGCFALDKKGGRFLVFGGTSDARTSQPGLWALNLDEGDEAWTEIPLEGVVPPTRSSCSSVYDPDRNQFVFGFGNGAAVYHDLWAIQL